MCALRWPDCEKHLSQPAWSHAYGFSPVCVRMCALRWPERSKLLPHPACVHVCLFSRTAFHSSARTCERMRAHSSPCPPACSLRLCSVGRSASLARHVPFSAMSAFSRSSACVCALQRGKSAVAIIIDCKIGTATSVMVSRTSRSEKHFQASATACFQSVVGLATFGLAEAEAAEAD